MNIYEFIKLYPTQNKYTFGKFVRLRREELGISLRTMAKKLEITASYLSDVENGERYAPIKIINEIKKEFMIMPDEDEIFMDLAYLTKDSCTPDIIEYLIANPEARKAIKLATKNKLDGNKLLEIVENIDNTL